MYQNPTTYDGDGFPTDGLVLTCTDSDLSSGQCGMESYNANSRGAYASDFYTAWAAVSSGLSIPVAAYHYRHH